MPSPLPLATLPEFPDFGTSVLFQLNGLIVVFVALGSIWGLLEIIGLGFRVAARVQAKRAALTAASAPPASGMAPLTGPPPGAPSPAVLSVIAAAVYIACGDRPYRIASVTAADRSLDWAREGRRAIFASRKPH